MLAFTTIYFEGKVPTLLKQLVRCLCALLIFYNKGLQLKKWLDFFSENGQE